MSVIKLLIVLLFLYAVYKVVTLFKRIKSHEVKGYRVNDTQPVGEELVQDPQCKTYVAKSQAYQKEIDGRQEYFCSRDCCEKYLSRKK